MGLQQDTPGCSFQALCPASHMLHGVGAAPTMSPFNPSSAQVGSVGTKRAVIAGCHLLTTARSVLNMSSRGKPKGDSCRDQREVLHCTVSKFNYRRAHSFRHEENLNMQNIGLLSFLLLFLFFSFFLFKNGLNTVSMAVNPTLTQIKFQRQKIHSAREGQC